MIKQNRAYLLALSAVLMWSTVGSAFKLTLRYMQPLEMLLIASFVSLVILAGIIFLQNKFSLFKRSLNTWPDLLRSVLLGLLNPFLFYIVLFNAYDLLLTQEAMVINFSWPVTLTLLSIPLLKQKIGWRGLLPILISFVGIIIIGTNGNILSLKFSNPAGVALALGSTVIWSLFWIYNIKDKRDDVIKLFWNFAFGFIYILITWSIVKDNWSLENRIIDLDFRAILGAVYIGIFEMGVAYVLWLKALQLSTTTARVSNLIFLAPFISLVIISKAVGEPILLSTLSGLILIVGGIALQRYWDKS